MIGSDEMSERVRAMDWSTTPLGDLAFWPQPLITLVQVMLGSKQPMFVVWGTEQTLIYNEALLPILAAKHPAALGSSFLEVWSEVRSELMPLVEQVYGGSPVHMNDLTLAVHRKGYEEEAHFAFSYTPVRMPDGHVSGFFCACTETTHQVIQDRLEERNRTRLATALRVARLGSYEWNVSTGEIVVDARGRKIFALPPEGIICDKDLFARIVAEDVERVRAEYSTALDRDVFSDEKDLQHTFDIGYTIECPDGSRRSVESSGTVVSERDGTRRLIGAFNDVTSFKHAQTWLRDQNTLLENRVAERTKDRNALWQLSSDIMLRCTFEGVITAINPAWNTLLGWSEEELVGTSLYLLIHPDDLRQTADEVKRLSEGTCPRRIDNRLQHRGGGYRWISWLSRAADGVVNAVGRDVTEDKEKAEALNRAEEALRQSQKLEIIGQLTGGVAHDFNNLLTVIRSSADLLKRPDLASERRARYIKASSDTVDRAAKVTSQLLAFARRQALTPEVFAVCDSVRSLAEMMKTLAGSQIEILMDLPETRCFVEADPNQFDTALVNIAVNARDAMSGKGRLTIRVESVEQMPAVLTHPAVCAPFVAVSMTDTGKGIAAEYLERIFEPFFTTKGVGQGTGLGLSQVFGFAKQSGGEVTVTSEVGKGSVFTLYLPRVEQAIRSPEKEDLEPEALVNGHGTGVLVVEDNVEVGTFAVQSLSDLGYVPVLANNAEEALIELAQDAKRFSVVFSDVVMPGMSGIELGHEIRRLYHDLPVVLASGYSHVLAQNGTYGFELLHKPYSIEQLSRLLRKVAQWQRRKRIIGK
jgi:PAS domain S-box-containing protein